MEVLALVIGRGGSTRVPGKNVLPLGGRPLIAWSVDCALNASLVTRTLASTDDQEIADACGAAGAEVPFLRPKEYAGDDSPDSEAVLHALDWLQADEGYRPDLVAVLRASSPFRKPETLDRAIRLLADDPAAHSTRSVTLCREHPHKMWRIEGNRLLHLVPPSEKIPEAHDRAYQLLPEVYVQNASFNVLRPENQAALGSLTGTEIIPVVMDPLEAIDINFHLDVLLAETALAQGLVAPVGPAPRTREAP